MGLFAALEKMPEEKRQEKESRGRGKKKLAEGRKGREKKRKYERKRGG